MTEPQEVFTEGERAFFRALDKLRVRYMVVGMGAALLQGARGATEDLDLWIPDLEDRAQIPALEEAVAAKDD